MLFETSYKKHLFYRGKPLWTVPGPAFSGHKTVCFTVLRRFLLVLNMSRKARNRVYSGGSAFFASPQKRSGENKIGFATVLDENVALFFQLIWHLMETL